MFRRYKYDVAFSVAEEDIAVAQQIADALRLRGIKFYLYTDRNVDDWGKDLVDVTFRRYAKESKFTLLITSKTFVTKYWTGIENQVIQSYSLRKEDVLTLRIDDSSVDGLSQFKVFVQWENNPDEIAAKIEKKVKKWKRRIRTRISFIFSISSFLVALLSYFYFTNHPGKIALPEKHVVVPKDTIDTARPKIGKDTGDKKIREQEQNFTGKLLVEGNVKDETTGEFLDDVMVTIEGVQSRTKNGRYNIVLPETPGRRRGTELSVGVDYSKVGYQNLNSVETFFWSKDMTQKNINISLTKLN